MATTRTVTTFGTRNQTEQAPQSSDQKKPAPTMYLNVGYEVEFLDEDGNVLTNERGEPETLFISLPKGGIPLDYLMPAPVYGDGSTIGSEKIIAGNDYLHQLQAAAKNLKPGTRGARFALVGELYKVPDETTPKKTVSDKSRFIVKHNFGV